MRPLLVVEGPIGPATTRVGALLGEARAAGWTVVRGWAAPLTRDRVLCTGTVRSADDARRALLAAISGAGLAVVARVGPEVVDPFVDDLRRLGPVEHVHVTGGLATPLTAEQRELLRLLGDGFRLSEAADTLGIPRRTADRRVAEARRALGVTSTAEAIVASLTSRN